MDQLAETTAPRPRSFVIDGPPFPIVAMVFIAIVVVAVGMARPAAGMAVLAVGLAATVALEFRAWHAAMRPERAEVEASFASLPDRLRAAKARQVERDRWR